MKKWISLKVWLPIVLYVAGVFFIGKTDVTSLKEKGVVSQDEYYYTDSDGEDREGETLVDMKGIGRVLLYKDVYLASVPIFILSLFLSEILFHGKVDRFIECAMIANCTLGLLLIWLTTKGTIVSTVLFWLGVFAAGYCRDKRQDV